MAALERLEWKHSPNHLEASLVQDPVVGYAKRNANFFFCIENDDFECFLTRKLALEL